MLRLPTCITYEGNSYHITGSSDGRAVIRLHGMEWHVYQDKMFAILTSHYREQVSIQACGELIASYDITNPCIVARYLSTRLYDLFTFRVTRSHSSDISTRVTSAGENTLPIFADSDKLDNTNW